jgi:hypothetical protein
VSNQWDERAARLQERGRETEADRFGAYDDEQVRRAIVYTREDVILLVSYLSSANEKLSYIRSLLRWLIAAVLAVGAGVIFLR